MVRRFSRQKNDVDGVSCSECSTPCRLEFRDTRSRAAVRADLERSSVAIWGDVTHASGVMRLSLAPAVKAVQDPGAQPCPGGAH